MKKLLLVLAIIFLIPSMSYSVEPVKINAFFYDLQTDATYESIQQAQNMTARMKRFFENFNAFKVVDIPVPYTKNLDEETINYLSSISDGNRQQAELAKIFGYEYNVSGYIEKTEEKKLRSNSYEITVNFKILVLNAENSLDMLASFNATGTAQANFSKKPSKKQIQGLKLEAIDDAALNIGKKLSEIFSNENFNTDDNKPSQDFYDIPVNYEIQNASQNYTPINPDSKRIGIIGFNSKANEVSDREASSAENFLTRMLTNSNSLTILERERFDDIAREHRLNLSGLIDPKLAVRVGKLAGCQYILTGAVTEFSGRKSKSKTNKRNVIYNDVSVTLDIRLINIETSEIILALSEKGNASQSSNYSGNFSMGVFFSGVDSSANSSFTSGGIINAAIENAVSKIAPKLRASLFDESQNIIPQNNHIQNNSRLGVVTFTSRTNEIEQRQVISVTNTLSSILSNSKSVSILERDRLDKIISQQKLNLNDPNSAVKLGKLAGCQYILLGSITGLTEKFSSSGKVNSSIFSGKASGHSVNETEAKIDARIIDVTTGKIIFSVSKTGIANYSNSYSSSGGKSTSSTAISDMLNVKERAVTNAAIMIAEEIRSEFFGEYSAIISVGSREIKINRGSKSGIKNGDYFMVNDSMGTILKVNNVHNDFSSVEVVKGSVNSLQRGDKIKLLSQYNQ